MHVHFSQVELNIEEMNALDALLRMIKDKSLVPPRKRIGKYCIETLVM